MDISITEVKNTTDLYCKYSGQTEAQPCYIELDCESKRMIASYNAEIGNAIPFSVFHGHDQRFGIPCLTAKAANEIMEHIAPLANRIIEGYSSEWDGNNNVAVFTDDAKEAIEEIENICNDLEPESEDLVQAIDASDWMQYDITRKDADGKPCHYDDAITVIIDDETTITANTTDDELINIENRIVGFTDSNVIIDDLDSWLSDERDNCINNS
jgi:hypothetical protein